MKSLYILKHLKTLNLALCLIYNNNLNNSSKQSTVGILSSSLLTKSQVDTGNSDIIESSTGSIDNIESSIIPLEENNNEDDDDVAIDDAKREEFLDAISQLATEINDAITLAGGGQSILDDVNNDNAGETSESCTDDDTDDEFDIDSMLQQLSTPPIGVTRSNNKGSNSTKHNTATEEEQIKARYRQYLAQKFNNDDDSVQESGYKMHMKHVVSHTAKSDGGVTGKHYNQQQQQQRRRKGKKRTPATSRKKSLDILSSVCESTTVLDDHLASSGSASDSEASSAAASSSLVNVLAVDELTEQTSQLVANLQDYISNIE